MPIRIFSDFGGTVLDSIRVGVNRLKNVSNVLRARNRADTSDVAIGARSLKLSGSGSGEATLAVPAAAGSPTFTLPAAVPGSTLAMMMDNTGQISFAAVATGSNAMKAEDVAIAFGQGTTTSFQALPAGATIHRVIVEVETAFDGTPSLSVGITGVLSKYFGATDVDLAVAATYEVAPMAEEAGTVTPLVTYSAGGATVGLARVTVIWVLPD